MFRYWSRLEGMPSTGTPWARAWDEVGLRFDYARRSGLFRLSHLPGLLALFLVRVMPGPVKRLAYKHLR